MSAEEKERQFKGRHCRALRKNSDIAGRGVRQQRTREKAKELVHFHLL